MLRPGFLNSIVPLKLPGLIGEMADSGTGAGKVQGIPEASVFIRKCGSLKKKNRGLHSDTRPSLKGFPLAKSGIIWASKLIMIVMGYKTWN